MIQHLENPIEIIKQNWAEDSIPLVSIDCKTYNHENYIRDAIEGFLMQKTTFPVEILIHDDASTDKTAKIVHEYETKYPELIKPIYQTENQYSKKEGIIGKLQRGRAKGKYIALCEGDDYWTDPLKLQKQVSFLEKNPEYIFCCHRFKILLQNTQTYRNEYAHHYYQNSNLIIDRELYSKTWITQPLTSLIRAKEFQAISKEIRKYKGARDVHIFYYLLKRGKGISLNEFMGVYRFHDGGVASNPSAQQNYLRGYNTYKELFNHNKDDIFLKRKFAYNLIRHLRYGDTKSFQHNFSIFKEGFSLGLSRKDKISLFISFITPRFIFNFLGLFYRQVRLFNNKSRM